MILSKEIVPITVSAEENSSVLPNAIQMIDSNSVENDFGLPHPSNHMRYCTTDIQRQNINVMTDYNDSIINYTKILEL